MVRNGRVWRKGFASQAIALARRNRIRHGCPPTGTFLERPTPHNCTDPQVISFNQPDLVVGDADVVVTVSSYEDCSESTPYTDYSYSVATVGSTTQVTITPTTSFHPGYFYNITVTAHNKNNYCKGTVADCIEFCLCCEIAGIPDVQTQALEDDFDGSALSSFWTDNSIAPGSASVGSGLLTLNSAGGVGRAQINGALGTPSVIPTADDWQFCTRAELGNTSDNFIGLSDGNTPFHPNMIGIAIDPVSWNFAIVANNSGPIERISMGVPVSPGMHDFIVRHYAGPLMAVEFSIDGSAFTQVLLNHLPATALRAALSADLGVCTVDSYCLRVRTVAP